MPAGIMNIDSTQIDKTGTSTIHHPPPSPGRTLPVRQVPLGPDAAGPPLPAAQHPECPVNPPPHRQVQNSTVGCCQVLCRYCRDYRVLRARSMCRRDNIGDMQCTRRDIGCIRSLSTDVEYSPFHMAFGPNWYKSCSSYIDTNTVP